MREKNKQYLEMSKGLTIFAKNMGRSAYQAHIAPKHKNTMPCKTANTL
jgi:hypothetical protein